MFECDMAGCFDSATYDIEFVNGEKFQICDSCESYWKHNDFGDVKSIKEFANRKGN